MGIFDSLQSVLGSVTKGAAGGSSASVVGVDIGSSAIKVVQLKREHGRAILETYGEIALGPYSSTEVGRATHLDASTLANALKDLLTESNVTARTAGIAIPFSSSLTAVIEMPNLPQSQLDKMVPLEARKYIPIPVNEVTLNWFTIPKDPVDNAYSHAAKTTTNVVTDDKHVEVLLVAIHNEAVATFQTVAAGSGLTSSFFELEVFSGVRSTLGHGIAPVLLIDIGAATTKVYIVERGIVRASHLINIGSQELTLSITRALGWSFDKAERVKREVGLTPRSGEDAVQDEKVKQALLSTLGRMIAEINRVLLTYEKRNGQSVSLAIFAGGTAGLAGLDAYVREHMNVELVRADPFSKVQAPAFLSDILKEVGPEFAVAVGAALRALQE